MLSKILVNFLTSNIHIFLSTAQNGFNMHRLQQERRKLPIFPAKHKLIQQMRMLDTAIVIGETGSGKTTQIPQVILNMYLDILMNYVMMF